IWWRSGRTGRANAYDFPGLWGVTNRNEGVTRDVSTGPPLDIVRCRTTEENPLENQALAASNGLASKVLGESSNLTHLGVRDDPPGGSDLTHQHLIEQSIEHCPSMGRANALPSQRANGFSDWNGKQGRGSPMRSKAPPLVPIAEQFYAFDES